METSPNPAAPVLRPGAILREAYAVWFANFGLWLKLLLVPAAVIAVLSIVSVQLLAGSDDEIMMFPSVPTGIAVILFQFIIYLSQIPLATAWHRLILTSDDAAAHRYRIGGPEGRYLLKIVVITLIVLVVFLMIGLMLSFLVIPALMLLTTGGRGVPDPFLMMLVGSAISIGVYTILGYWFGYLLLMLPAAAIGRDYTGSEAAAAMGDNRWRLIGVYVLALLPLVVLEYLLQWLLGGPAMKSGAIAALVQYGPTLLFAPVIIGVLSITYRELVQKPEAGVQPRPSS